MYFLIKNLIKNFTFLTFDLYIFKLNLKESKIINLETVNYIYKYMEIGIFFHFLYGKLQNNINTNIENFKKGKFIKNIILNFYNITYENIEKFKILYINCLLLISNITKNFINFNFIKFLWSNIEVLNKRNIRKDENLYKVSGIFAFKMSFKGRFSRKQRASNIWYAYGRASLNRINIKVDYAFVKIPIKNSVVSIKIWLFKNSVFKKFKYILSI